MVIPDIPWNLKSAAYGNGLVDVWMKTTQNVSHLFC